MTSHGKPTLPTAPPVTSRKTVRAVGVGGIPLCLPVSEPTTVSIGPFTENVSSFTTSHSFLLSDTTPVNLLGRDLLCKLNCTIYCTPDGIFLETNHGNATAVIATLTEQIQPISEEKGEVYDRIVSSVPPTVWASSTNDVGLIKTAEPVQVLLKHDTCLPRIPQYPLSQERREGIRPVIQSLLTQGVIKPGKQEYRFVQDLRAINKVVLPRFPLVPNPTTVLSSLPASSTHYTVLDLCSAFFSVPLHTDSQYLFAFTYEGKQYTFTRLPQGYTESPTIFSRALHSDLKDVSFPGGSVLVQYVDDLLLASPSASACETDTIVLLNALAVKGHKASLKKAQMCQTVVQYLGHTLSGSTRVLTPSRVKAILEVCCCNSTCN
uniref:ribonuclease H n=1 Tax=Echeneis naucrates TaxID=173247 RepID=A0A665THK9_ECHNA